MIALPELEAKAQNLDEDLKHVLSAHVTYTTLVLAILSYCNSLLIISLHFRITVFNLFSKSHYVTSATIPKFLLALNCFID